MNQMEYSRVKTKASAGIALQAAAVKGVKTKGESLHLLAQKTHISG